MQLEQEFQEAERAIIQFADSYRYNKSRKQNEQSISESALSLTKVTTSIKFLRDKISNNYICKSVINTPNLLKSLATLTSFQIDTHMNYLIDLQRYGIRSLSRDCLSVIQYIGDASDKTDLVNERYGRVLTIPFSTAGGHGEEQNQRIYLALCCIYNFLRQLHLVKNDYWYMSFPPFPQLARSTVEQIVEEGGNEEIEAQINNKGLYYNFKDQANSVKATVLNFYIDNSNTRPDWYN
ncbi:MAG: hypothetical protein EZS28_039675 [Streblomastix strix]|uniref:Uncharacterized protein n=1 Tax=Streblomastix strix TaxID=222440 RepID=A0A5J4U3D4_9EUKA|nr:MAG: hypothetical protein EZS28_039675 [Streblomastix strix]